MPGSGLGRGTCGHVCGRCGGPKVPDLSGAIRHGRIPSVIVAAFVAPFVISTVTVALVATAVLPNITVFGASGRVGSGAFGGGGGGRVQPECVPQRRRLRLRPRRVNTHAAAVGHDLRVDPARIALRSNRENRHAERAGKAVAILAAKLRPIVTFCAYSVRAVGGIPCANALVACRRR